MTGFHWQMNRAGLALLVLVLGGSIADAQSDRVFPKEGRTLTGAISKVSAKGITIETGGREVEVPATEIKMVNFGTESREITTARRAISEERLNNALQILESIDSGQLDPPALALDVDYLTAYCIVKMALSGERGTLDQATGVLTDFLEKGGESYHYTNAVELLGDLLLARGVYDQAEAQYQRLVSTPWPDVQQIGRLKVGRMQELQGKYSEALKNYQAVQQVESTTAESRQSKLEAQVGQARCQAFGGDFESGIATLNQMIVEESSTNGRLFGQIYNALGNCYVAAKQPKQAINAFLHTDLLFYQDPEQHAEALYRLGELFNSMSKFEESAEAREKLKSRYGTSPWAKK